MYIGMNKKNSGTRGFAAIGIVCVVSGMALFFIARVSASSTNLSKSVREAEVSAEVRLNVISCAAVVAKKLASTQDTADAVGEYYIGTGRCLIDSVSHQQNRYYITVKTELEFTRVVANIELDSANYKILSIKEF
jgi:hypothetical protein